MMDGHFLSRFAIPGLNDAQRAEMTNAQVLLVRGCADDVAERIATLGAQCWGHDRGGCGS
jgi:DNA-binding ferritin-like protein